LTLDVVLLPLEMQELLLRFLDLGIEVLGRHVVFR
jgi:hypothetical protein